MWRRALWCRGPWRGGRRRGNGYAAGQSRFWDGQARARAESGGGSELTAGRGSKSAREQRNWRGRETHCKGGMAEQLGLKTAAAAGGQRAGAGRREERQRRACSASSCVVCSGGDGPDVPCCESQLPLTQAWHLFWKERGSARSPAPARTDQASGRRISTPHHLRNESTPSAPSAARASSCVHTSPLLPSASHS